MQNDKDSTQIQKELRLIRKALMFHMEHGTWEDKVKAAHLILMAEFQAKELLEELSARTSRARSHGED